jgi:hypothetical protein
VIERKSVEKYVGQIFMKLDLPVGDKHHDRRVQAVLRYLARVPCAGPLSSVRARPSSGYH